MESNNELYQQILGLSSPWKGWMCGLRWKGKLSISPSSKILKVGSAARSATGNTVITIMPPVELGDT